MKSHEIDQLIRFGATDRARKKLKKLAIKPRLNCLRDCIPMVKKSGAHTKFFAENFRVELGAIMMAEGDLDRAEELYQSSKKNK